MNELEYLKKYIHPEDNLEEAIKRLEAGEPVQYIIGNVNLYETSNRKNQNKTNTTSNSNSDNKNLFQDTPQGQLDFTDLENQKWATNYTINKSTIGDQSESIGNNDEDFTRHIYGNNGNKYNIELLNDVKNNLLNIDMLIINELNDLFMGIY